MKDTFTVIYQQLVDVFDANEAFLLAQWLVEERLGEKLKTVNQLALKFQGLSKDHALWNELEALAAGKPIQQVLGKAYFLDLELAVNQHTLIPRPETEELVDYTKTLFSQTEELSIIDVGTGSGCIPIALARHFKKATVQGADISDKALLVAQQNAERYNLAIDFSSVDFLKEFPNGNFDLIISNPPYIVPSEKADMHKNVVDFEPKKALFVPQDDPLVFYKRLKQMADGQLKPAGFVMLEINPLYATETRALFAEGYTSELIKDMQGKERFVKARKK